MLTKRSGSFKYCIYFLFAFPLTTSAQNLKKIAGHYINLNGDTVKGYFTHYKEWSNNPSTVSFMPVDSVNKTTLTPVNTRSFAIDNYDSYIAYSGTRLTNPIELYTTLGITDSTDQIENTTCFLRTIFSSDTFKLYVLSDKWRSNFFYQTSSQPLTELKRKNFLDNNGSLIEMTLYKDQLYELFAKQITEQHIKTNELQYEETSLLDLLNMIFQTSGSVAVNTKHPTLNKPRFFITGGLSFNSFAGSGDKALPQSKASYGHTIAPLLALGWIIPTQRNFGKFSLSPQVKLSLFNVAGSYSSSIDDTTTIKYKADLKADILFYGGYNIVQRKNINWRLAAGAGLSLLLNNQETLIIAYRYGPTRTIISKQRSLIGSFNLQTSLLFSKKIIFLLNYNLPTATTNYVFYSGELSSLQLTAGWVF